MRPCLPGLLLAALFGAGCEPFADSPIYFHGLALREDGTPFSHTALTVEGSAPLPSGAPREVPEYVAHAVTTTRGNGAFSVEILAGDIMSYVDGRKTLDRPTYRERYRVATPLENGRGTFLSFTQGAGGGDAELPVMQVWAANLARAESPTGPVLTFAALPPEPKAPMGVTQREYTGTSEPPELKPARTPLPILRIQEATGVVWEEREAASPWALAPWMLEDFTSVEAQVRVVSADEWRRTPVISAESWLTFRQEWRSERLPLPPGTLRPLSRGAACLPELSAPCPFTDGLLGSQALHEVWPGTQTPSAAPLRVGIRLDTSARLARLVVRNLKTFATELLVEGSEEGTQWFELARRPLAPQNPQSTSSHNFRELAQSDSPWDPPLLSGPLSVRYFLDIPLTDARPVRFVRLSPLWGGNTLVSVVSLAELSLFEGAPP